MAEKLAVQLKSLGASVDLECETQAEPESFDLLVVLGGDGTILRAARQYAMDGVPLLGINMGTLGFLSNLKVAGLENCLQELIDGQYNLDERMLLEASIYEGDTVRKTVYCLNEVAVRSQTARMISCEVMVSDQVLGIYRGDGVLVATPTGSTAYSLSAGGPICDPALEAFVLTPLASHNLSKRPLIIDAKNELVIKPIECNETIISLDGQVKIAFEPSFTIRVRKADRKLKLVQLHPAPFFATLNERIGRIEEL